MGMRKAWLLVAILLVAGRFALGADDTILIASWNVQNLTDGKCVACLADVITDFDLVALQEVESLDALARLVDALEQRMPGVDWDEIHSDLVGEGNAAEHYAFIFRLDKVCCFRGTEGVYSEFSDDDFSREPFYATFRARKFDFTLVTVHITWGDSAALRTAECGRLVDVWENVQAMDPDENDIILLGDFNRDKPTHSAFDPLRTLGIVALIEAEGTRTTFGRSPTGGSWYDNLWIDPLETTTLERTGFVGVGTLDRNSLGSGCPEYLRGVSDHCPVWVEFFIAAGDDD